MKLRSILLTAYLLAVPLLPARAEQVVPLSLKNPEGVAYDGKGRLIISDSGNHRLLVFQDDQLIAQIGKEGNGPGEFQQPKGITLDSQGRLIVCDSGNGRIQIFDPELTFVAAFGKPSSDTDKSPGTFARPSGVTTDDRDNILVADTWNHRIQVFDATGKFIRLYDNGDKAKTDMECFNEVGGVFCDGRGRLFVANGWNSRCDIYDYDSATQALHHRGEQKGQIWGFWVCCDVAVNSKGEVVALDTNNGGVNIYPPDFEKDNRNPQRRFTGGLFGSLRQPRAVAIGPGDEIAVCDTNNDRVLILRDDFQYPPPPQVLSMGLSSLTIAWRSLLPAKTTLMLREGNVPGEGEGLQNAWHNKEKVRLVAGKTAPSGTHIVTVRNLKPSTRYWYKLHVPVLRKIPDPGFTQEYSAVTSAEPKTKRFVRLPMAVVVFPNVFNLDTWGADSAPPEAATKERQRYYVEECNKGSRFYWVNTRMNLLLDNLFFPDENWYYLGKDPLDSYSLPKEMKEQIKGHPPGYREILTAKSLKPEDFCGVVVITAQRRWDKNAKEWVYEGSGGGTYGIRYPVRPGETEFLGGSDIAWLYTHEVGHQVDSFFTESGIDGTAQEWMFNHFAPMMNTAYKHGEHYDGNAWLSRAVPPQRFFQLKYGEVCTAADNDDDGIPDNDKRVPLDEVRFRSNPAMVDTDYDGLSDLDEALASSWIFEMLPAVSNARADYRIPDPTDPDTDDDAIPDGYDKYPLYAADDTLPRAEVAPVLDGRIEPGAWSEVYTFTAGKARGTVFASWDENNLYLGFRFNQEIPRFYFQLDLDNNGWYVGKDNYEITVTSSNGNVAVADAWVNNCAEKKKWPFRDNRLGSDMKVRVAGGVQDSQPEIEVAIPQRREVGLDLEAAEVIGFTLNCLLEQGTDKWVSAFEPYHFFELSLAERE
jgi:sugar lactone lactonase YvrE